MSRVLSDEERLAWVQLARTETVGPATFASLLRYFGDIREAVKAAPQLAHRGQGELRLPTVSDAARELDAARRFGARVLACVEPDFPPGLAVLDPPPPLITVAGNVAILRREAVAIVGARNASALGLKLARTMATDLGRADLVIVSGLARGIDAAAHEGARATGTIAVIAGGIDVVYPPENEPLYRAIREEGAVLSEMPFGLAPLAKHFPRRNRIISGLSRGVVVIEAAERSGSLITANYALEQGREVFAVPGSPLDPRARGCNRLLRDGATLTESADDVLTVLEPILGRVFGDPTGPDSTIPPMASQHLDGEADRVRAMVQEKLGPAPVEIDELVRQCGTSAAAVLTVVLELELAGRARRHPGNRVSWA